MTLSATAVSAAEIASMAAEAQIYMDKSVQIQRDTRTSDSAGHTGSSWTTVHTTVCSMAPPTGSFMAQEVALLGELASWVITFPNGTDVLRGDRLVIGSDTLAVQHVFNPATYSYTNQVLASEVR